MASRWTQALKFVWRERQHWARWRKFVRENGGVFGCARAIAKAKKEIKARMRKREQDDTVWLKKQAQAKNREPMVGISSAQASAVVSRTEMDRVNADRCYHRHDDRLVFTPSW